MTYGPDDRAAELAQRDATSQYRPLTDESEAASGDGVVFADESEWADDNTCSQCGDSLDDDNAHCADTSDCVAICDCDEHADGV